MFQTIVKSLSHWGNGSPKPLIRATRAVKLKSGKKTHPLHKELYKAILNGTVPIVDLIEDADAEAAIYGAIMMHATRMLRKRYTSSGLTSPYG